MTKPPTGSGATAPLPIICQILTSSGPGEVELHLGGMEMPLSLTDAMLISRSLNAAVEEMAGVDKAIELSRDADENPNWGPWELEFAARRPAPVQVSPAPADLERLAEAVHVAYLETCARLGWDVKPANRVPYAALAEDSKELDRASVRAVLALASPAAPVPLDAPLVELDLHAFLVRFMQTSTVVAAGFEGGTAERYDQEAREFLVDEELHGVPIYTPIEGPASPVLDHKGNGACPECGCKSARHGTHYIFCSKAKKDVSGSEASPDAARQEEGEGAGPRMDEPHGYCDPEGGCGHRFHLPLQDDGSIVHCPACNRTCINELNRLPNPADGKPITEGEV